MSTHPRRAIRRWPRRCRRAFARHAASSPLRSGDCVTILASVLLADLRMSTVECRGTSSTVDISIQGLWADADDSSSSCRDPADGARRRRGAVLCVLRLPAEMLFLSPPMTPPPPIGALDTSRGGFRPPRRPRARRRASSPTEIQRYIRVSTAPDHRDRHVRRIGLHARRRNVETLRVDCECQRRREFLRRFVL